MSKHIFKKDDIVLIRKNDPDSKWVKARYVHMVDNDTKHVCNFIYNKFITDLNLSVEVGKDFIVPYMDQTRFLEGTKENYSWLNSLKSEQLVLVTNELDNKDIWLIASFSGIHTSGYKEPEFGVYATNNSRKYYNYCIPYEGNEHKRNKIAKKEDLIYDYQ